MGEEQGMSQDSTQGNYHVLFAEFSAFVHGHGPHATPYKASALTERAQVNAEAAVPLLRYVVRRKGQIEGYALNCRLDIRPPTPLSLLDLQLFGQSPERLLHRLPVQLLDEMPRLYGRLVGRPTGVGNQYRQKECLDLCHRCCFIPVDFFHALMDLLSTHGHVETIKHITEVRQR